MTRVVSGSAPVSGRVHRGQFVPVAAAEQFRFGPLDPVDRREPGAGRALRRRDRRPGDQKSLLEGELLDQGLRDVGVARPGGVVPGWVAEEAEPLGMKFENALRSGRFGSGHRLGFGKGCDGPAASRGGGNTMWVGR
jgi:hypothetical protein